MIRFTCGRLLLCLFCLLSTGLLCACGGSGKDSALPAPVQIDLEQQLSELDSLPLPEGVDSALWQELKGSLRAMLAAKGKAVREAPQADASATVLSVDTESLEASWRYFNQGDYDQNGEVNISDITPIAQNFGESNGGSPFPAASALSVVDGDGNGEINIADLTPIGLNFGVRVGSYNIYTSASPDDYPAGNSAPNGDGAEFVGSVQLAFATGEPSETRLALSFTLPEPPPTGYLWLRPCDSVDGTGQLGTPSNLLDPLQLNAPPVAMFFTFTPAIHEQAPVLQVFQISGTHDPDGSIANYEFDFDGDGSYEVSQVSEPQLVEHTYTEHGLFRARMRVTDNDGAQAVAEQQVSINGGGNLAPSALLQLDVSAGDAPLAVNFDASGSSDGDDGIVSYDWDIDGLPGFEILDSSETQQSFTYVSGGVYFAYLRVTDASGAQSLAAEFITVSSPDNLLPVANLTVDSSAGAAPLSVLLDASGSQDIDGSVVKYHWDFGGDGDHDITTTDPRLEFTFHKLGTNIVQVFAVDNDGGISAADSVEIELSSGWDVKVVALSVIGADTDLVIVDVGNQEFEPLIAVTEHGDNFEDLSVRHGINQASSFSSATLVHGSASVFDMEVVEGRPAVALNDGELYYMRAENTSGTSWTQPLMLDGGFGSGLFGIDLEHVESQPAITYNAVNNPAQFIRSMDLPGDLWAPSTLTGLDYHGIDPLLLHTGDWPLIFVTHYETGDILRFRGTNSFGDSFEDRTVVLAGDGLPRQFSAEVQDGLPLIAWCQYGKVYLIRGTDSAGSAWEPVQKLVDMGGGRYATSAVLRDIAGRLGLAFTLNSGMLWYMESDDAAGISWGEPQLVDADEAGGVGVELAAYLGEPAISYCNGSGGLLKFAWLRQ